MLSFISFTLLLCRELSNPMLLSCIFLRSESLWAPFRPGNADKPPCFPWENTQFKFGDIWERLLRPPPDADLLPCSSSQASTWKRERSVI